MARHMERLEADGVVTRTRDRVDRRLLRVSLTDRGLELHHRLWKVSQRTNEQLSAAFTDQELAQFESSLDRIAAQASALLEQRTGGNGMTATEVIRTEALTKVYPGDVKAVDSLDLAVNEGEIFGLLGPNGAGKSTTAGMLTTRVIPTSGSASVAGIDVVKHPTRAKQVIGVVPQTNTLDRSLSVRENLYFHGRFFGMSAAAVSGRGDRADRPDQAQPLRRCAGGHAVGRDGAAADGGAGDHAPPGDPVPRRADVGPRPAEPPRPLRHHQGAQRRGPDRAADDALHGGGRPAVRTAGDHRPRSACSPSTRRPT